jgi:SpoVK/Ycf46/Vps4 family AAA+-type ATPase
MAPSIVFDNNGDRQGALLVSKLAQALLAQNPIVVNGGDGENSENGSTSESTIQEAEIVYEPAGTIVEAINLYEGQPDNRGRVTWTRKYPDGLEDPPENAQSEQYALLIRNKKCYNGRKKLEIDSLVIQSQRLKAMLGKVFEGYPGLMTDLDRVEFEPPFEPFVHRWEAFIKAREDEQDPITKKHADLLWDVLEVELRDAIREKNDHVAHGVVQFKNIWTIFEPGTLIFNLNSEFNAERVYRLDEGTFATNDCIGPHYRLNVDYVDFDGHRFGSGKTALAVPAFAGTQDITKLSAFPLNFHPDEKGVRERVIERGHLFESLKGYHFKHYEGIALEFGTWGKIRRTINSRVILDTHAFHSFNPGRRMNLNQLDGENLIGMSSGDFTRDYSHKNEMPKSTDSKEKLTEDQLLLATDELRGYSLKDKKWLIFFIPHVKDIVWNEDAFKSLVAPPNQKELILAFTRSQRKNKERFDDVIQGKGRGIIMLLSGPPGVGKTLTAESVAETMKVPLYTMSSGDLGTLPREVEASLSNILEMNTKWNAVLLLDECDVFLEERSPHDIERNKLVSIFLRMLEYYEGILFLTTNRVENMDAAFESRIHLSLQYKELDKASRLHVWQTFLSRSTRVEKFSTEQLDVLAEEELNGRQIKNVLKTAQLLASDQGKDLNYEHVKVVMEIRKNNKSSS